MKRFKSIIVIFLFLFTVGINSPVFGYSILDFDSFFDIYENPVSITSLSDKGSPNPQPCSCSASV